MPRPRTTDATPTTNKRATLVYATMSNDTSCYPLDVRLEGGTREERETMVAGIVSLLEENGFSVGWIPVF